MRLRVGFLLTCAVGALSIGAASIAPQAAAADLVTKAKPETPAPDLWWFSGYLEAGGRFFVNNPQRDGVKSNGDGSSLAKYYEYSTIKPGPFMNGHASAGTNNGLYQYDIWAKNVGYSDQSYSLDASKAGEHYLTLGWDQTPHLYSTSSRTLYNGVGTTALTLPAGLSNALFNAAGCVAGTPPTGCVAGLSATPATAAANAAAVKALIAANVYQTDIGIRRDTASVDYRWTPTDAWDVKADYSNMRRTGTQLQGVVMSPGTSGVRTDVPRPIADTTQNFGLNGEYAGRSFWGQKFNVKFAYYGSIYRDDFDSYTVENPFCPTGATAGMCARNGSASSPLARVTTPPDNQANGFSGTLGADLPWKSRYMGTVSYNMMRQNQAFLPMTISPLVINNTLNTTLVAPPGLPAASLNGAINTLLSNNVLTTQITPDLKSKLSYRYYNFDNQTPELLIKDWVVTDYKLATIVNATYAPVQTLSISYTKQNAAAEMTWRPTRQWNVGAAYGYERYNWTRADADVTNENSGKVYADWKPTDGITARGSWFYSQRRYDNYNYLSFVGMAQWPNGATNTRYSTAYRQFFLDNRDRNKGQFSLSVDLPQNITVTPTLGLQYDDYRLNPLTEVGLNSNHSYNAGVEVTYLMTRDTRFLFSYTYEHQSQLITSTQIFPPALFNTGINSFSSNVENRVNTFIASVDHALIPNKLDLRLGYTVSYAVYSQPVIFADGSIPTVASTGGQIPDVKSTFQRLDAIATYKFDEDLVRQFGWKGAVTAKLRYAWERNSVNNWAIDEMQNYMYNAAFTGLASLGYMTWLAGDNPNYNVHLIAASLAWKW